MSKKAPSLGSLINTYLFYSYSIDISPTKTLIFMNIFIRGQMYVFPQVILQTLKNFTLALIDLLSSN